MPPVVLIAAAAGAVLGGAGLFTAFAVAGSFALAGGLTFGGLALAQHLLTPKPPSFDIGTVRADTRSTLRAAISPARWVLGRARIASVLAYYLEPEKSDRKAFLVLSICEGPIEGIERIWVDGKEIPWNDGTTDHVLGTEGDIIKEFAAVHSSKYGSRPLRMRFFYNGGEQVNDYFPGNFKDNQWTKDHKLSGKVVALIKLEQPEYGTDASARVWYRLPNFEFLVKGQKISYPGVSVPTWSENAAAVRYWWLTQRRGLPSIAIHPQDFIHAFQVCDEIINSNLPAEYSEYANSGPRYTINGVVYSNDDHESVEAEMDFAWAGYALEVNGSYRFRPGLDRPISITIGPEDIIERGTDVAAPALSDRINAGSMRIAQSCAHDFTELALPEFKDDQAILRDGEKLLKDFRVRSYVTCPVAGGRLLAVMLRRARANKIYSRQITPGDRFERLNLIPTDRVLLNDPEYGLDNVPVVITSRTMNADWSLNLNFEEAPSDIYSTRLVLPPLYPNALNPIDVLRGPNTPANVVIYAEAVLTLDYTVHSVIHISWDDSPHRIRLIVEFLTPGPLTFRDEKLISGSSTDFIVPYEGVYRVTVWHVDIRNVLSRPYSQDIVIDWNSLGIIPLDQRVNEFINENEAFKLLAVEVELANEEFQHLTEEAELAIGAADRAAAAALLSEDAATASKGSAKASAGSAALSEEDAEVSAGSSLASARSARAAAAQASNASGSANAASQSALTASAKADLSGEKATAASVQAAKATTSASEATASATLAAASESSASGSSAAARSSRVAAAGSAGSALGSANAASQSALTASAKADLSGEKATAASVQAAKATTSASEATASAELAAASESSASGSSAAARSSRVAAAGSAGSALGSANAASQSALTASAKADLSGEKATAASVDSAKAATGATEALASATLAAASETSASGSSAAAQVSQVAAAGSAGSAASVSAGLTARVATEVKSNLGTILSAAVVLRAKAGSSGAALELVAFSNLTGSRSSAKIRADSLLVDASNFSVNAAGRLQVHSISADEIEANTITAGQISNTTGVLKSIVILPNDITGSQTANNDRFFTGISISQTNTVITFQRSYSWISVGSPR